MIHQDSKTLCVFGRGNYAKWQTAKHDLSTTGRALAIGINTPHPPPTDLHPTADRHGKPDSRKALSKSCRGALGGWKSNKYSEYRTPKMNMLGDQGNKQNLPQPMKRKRERERERDPLMGAPSGSHKRLSRFLPAPARIPLRWA